MTYKQCNNCNKKIGLAAHVFLPHMKNGILLKDLTWRLLSPLYRKNAQAAIFRSIFGEK